MTYLEYIKNKMETKQFSILTLSECVKITREFPYYVAEFIKKIHEKDNLCYKCKSDNKGFSLEEINLFGKHVKLCSGCYFIFYQEYYEYNG